MSRGDELRQLAAQLSVLAALEDSIALGLSRVMGPAGIWSLRSPSRCWLTLSHRSALGGALAQPRGRSVFVALSDPHVCLLSGSQLAPVPLRRCPNVHRVAAPAGQ